MYATVDSDCGCWAGPQRLAPEKKIIAFAASQAGLSFFTVFAALIPAEGKGSIDGWIGSGKVEIHFEICAVDQPLLSCSEFAKKKIVSTFGGAWRCLRLPNGDRVNLLSQDGMYS